MIVLNLTLDNIYEFKNFEINFAYPKKIVDSPLNDECLSYCPSFRYKKFVLLMGANASGKTTLGYALMNIMNFITRKEYAHIVSMVNDTLKDASFSIDFITDSKTFYRFETKISASKNNKYSSNNISSLTKFTPIKSYDTYEKCVKRLLESNELNDNYMDELEKIDSLSWMFRFTGRNDNKLISDTKDSEKRFVGLLDNTLKTLDPRIKQVLKIAKTSNTYLIRFENREEIIENGKLRENSTLSSGTKESIDIAYIIAAIKNGGYKFFYCDEKFSHVHSDTEKAFISLMIECLKEDNQLLMTSHNTNLLSLNLPTHSFAFFKRDDYGDCSTKCLFADSYIKRNTDSLRKAIENDIFASSPNIDSIFALKEI